MRFGEKEMMRTYRLGGRKLKKIIRALLKKKSEVETAGHRVYSQREPNPTGVCQS